MTKLLAAIAFLAAVLHLQLQTPPQTPQISLLGRAFIRGSEVPAPGVTLSIVATKDRGGAPVRTVITDGTGRFEMRGIPAGSYRLFAYGDGYLESQYGQRSSSDPVVPINLSLEEPLKEIAIAVSKPATMLGRVYDAEGRPVKNGAVQALRISYANGKRVLTQAKQTATDSQGDYRLFGLNPGDYLVSATTPEGPRVEGNVYIIPQDRASNRAPQDDPVVMPLAEAVREGRISAAAFDSEADQLTYYPFMLDPVSAPRIVLTSGETRSGIDIRLVRKTLFQVSGRVERLNGPVQSAVSVLLTPMGQTAERVVGTPPFRLARIVTGEAFVFSKVPAGAYLLEAQTTGSQVSPHTASMSVELTSSSLEGLQLTLRPRVLPTIRGRVRIEGRRDGEGVPELAGKNLMFGGIFSPSSSGDFSITNIEPGDYRLEVAIRPLGGIIELPSAFYIKQATLDTYDVLASPVRIAGSPAGRLEIIVSPNAGTFNGIVTGENGRPVPGVTVVLVPQPPRRGEFAAYRSGGTDSYGNVTFRGLRPGSYKAFAWSDIEPNAWLMADVIADYEPFGQLVQIDEGRATSATVKVAPAVAR